MHATLDPAVAKKTTKPPPTPEPTPEPPPKENARKPVILQMRGSDEWKAWVEELAQHEGQTLTALFERGIRELAERSGFRRPPVR